MQNEKSQRINKRFFEAWDLLLASGSIKSKLSFCVEYDVDRRNFDRLRAEPKREFQMNLLTVLVVDFGISASWLLTGAGSMFQK